MTAQDIIAKVKAQNWPQGSYVVFGSCPMALAGIREASDIDMLVSAELYEALGRQGWQEVVKSPNDKPLVRGDFEAHANWEFSSYSPTLEELLTKATVVDGVPFASLEDVRKWKAVGGRDKDVKDVKLIDAYLASGRASS